MADVDNLDKLSNAELRAQMIAQGLPNIPVTDSSRKVLVKRLRASLGGNATLPAASASPKKSSARRETLQPAFAAVADKPDGGSGASKSRRTIANTPSDTKETERRRQLETVGASPRQQEAPRSIVPPKVAPIQSRRISNSGGREAPLNERVVRKPETIAEEPSVPRHRTGENTLLVNSLIVLESDDEEEEQMAQAAQQVENQYSARPQLSATTTKIHDYISKPLYPNLEPAQEPQRYKPPTFDPITSIGQPRSNLASTYEYRAATTGATYGSYLNSPAQSYTAPSSSAGFTAGAASSSSSSYRRPAPRTFTNEFSDDGTEAEVDEEAKDAVAFESDFARNLARLRAERIGDRSSTYRSSLTGTTGARRSLRPNHDPASVAFKRWWQSLDRKYNVNLKLFILIVGLILFAVYRFFY